MLTIPYQVFTGTKFQTKALYHGSRSGIVGKITPCSRSFCEFGSGFYMGDRPEQPLTLIYAEQAPVFYEIELDMEELRCLRLDGLAWALFIACKRRRMDHMIGTDFYRSLVQLDAGCDLVIGKIADDWMFIVLDRFFQGEITDAALLQCLTALDLGTQYVAISQKACDQVKILAEHRLSEEEKTQLQRTSSENRAKGKKLADDICRAHRRDGRYFDELLEEVSQGVRFVSDTAL